MAENQGDGLELIEHYKALTDELDNKIQILVATMNEKDAQMMSLKEQYDEVLQNLQEREDKIVDLEFELLSVGQQKPTAKRSLFSEKTDVEPEKDESFYIKQLEEKDQEVERLNIEINKLNTEVRKRTGDLQGLVNKELWEKNRHIEKLENRHAAAAENKDKAIMDLKSDLSSKDLQLRILKDRISELGVEVKSPRGHQDKSESQDSSSAENVRILQGQLKRALEERNYFEEKIKDLQQKSENSTGEDKLLFIEKLREDIEHLQSEYEHSEKLRLETNEVCSVLSARLEELAMFLDSLLKQKSVLGFLGSQGNKKLRELIDQSLDLSRTFNMSMLSNTDQSLVQLSHITNLLNITEAENDLIGSPRADDDKICLSIIPGNVTLTYHSHLYASSVSSKQEEGNLNNSCSVVHNKHLQIIEKLRKQIENFKYELQLRDNEICKLNDLLYRDKSNENDFQDIEYDKSELQGLGDINEDMICEQAANKSLNTSTTLKYRSDNQSESEAWSEPDRFVSKARMGLESTSRPSSGKRSKLTCKMSSESTEEECSRSLSRTPSKKNLVETRQTIVELHKQICDLEEKLLEKDNKLIALEESNCEVRNLLKEETCNHNKIQTELSNFEIQIKDTEEKLITAEKQKSDGELKIHMLQKFVDELTIEKERLIKHIEHQTKDVQNEINLLEVERNNALKTAKEARKDVENAKNELRFAENKLLEMQDTMNNMETAIREEYEAQVLVKLRYAEEEFFSQLKSTEETAQIEIHSLQERIENLRMEYAQDYVKKSDINQKLIEVETIIKENEQIKSTIIEYEQSMEILRTREQEYRDKVLEYQDRVNLLRRDLDNATLQYSEAVLEKTKISNEKLLLDEELSKVNQKESEMKKQMSEIQMELMHVKQNYQKQVSLLQDQKLNLEVRISELESANAELHNRLISLRTAPVDHIYSSSLPSTTNNSLYDLGNRNIPVNQLVNYKRQCSDNSEYTSEEQVGEARVGGYVYSHSLPLQPNIPVDIERHEANSSPDLGIESDHGRFSSLEAQLNIPRPLLQTLELTESMSNLLDAENNQVQNVDCGDEHCCKKSLQMAHENSDLKKKLLRTRRALEETVTQLTLANQRKKQVEKTICKQIHKTSQVLRKAKANLDSGSETDVYKK